MKLGKLGSSGQDYLEVLLELSDKSEFVRSVDVAEKLGVSRASVSRAMNNLRNAGYINQEKYSDITLTEKGKQVAIEVRDRHSAIKKFLIEFLGVGSATAEIDACKMEHCISRETLEKLKEYTEKTDHKQIIRRAIR